MSSDRVFDADLHPVSVDDHIVAWNDLMPAGRLCFNGEAVLVESIVVSHRGPEFLLVRQRGREHPSIVDAKERWFRKVQVVNPRERLRRLRERKGKA